MSSVSQRLVLVGVDGSLQFGQDKQSSQKIKVSAEIALLDGKYIARSSDKNMFENVDQRKLVRGSLEGASRVGRFSVQSAGGGGIENQTQRFQPRALVGRGLRELSPGSNPVNHSCNKATPEFSSLNLGGKSNIAVSSYLPTKQENLSLCTKTDNKNPKMLQSKKSLIKFSYKEPKSRQEFSSYFLHFATPRPFYRAYSFI